MSLAAIKHSAAAPHCCRALALYSFNDVRMATKLGLAELFRYELPLLQGWREGNQG